MNKTALVFGGVFAGLAVILGAFGAHALKQVLDAAQLQTFETGVRYQMYHSFALLIVGILSATFSSKQIRLAAVFFIIGTICFSGSLYALVLLQMNGVIGLSGVGIITPIGGLFFIIGWIFMLLGILKK
jgi:uncharacterized membrane protein YgdD (TMEM256/DUF423 family)